MTTPMTTHSLNRPMARRRPWLLGLLVAALVVIGDQLSKSAVRDAITELRRPVLLTDFLALVPAWNPGISFGFLNGGGALSTWLLVGGAAVVIVLLLVWLFSAERQGLAIALGFIVGGAVGNMVDRARLGAVFDFIDVAIAGWHFWTFNLADAAITVGVVLLLWDGLFGGDRAAK